MDQGVENTQKIVVTGAVLLALFVVCLIGYSLYVKAKNAEGELANKIELESQTNKTTQGTNISVTGESRNSASFTYDNLIQKKSDEATTTNFEVVDETVPVTVPEEQPEITPSEEPIIIPDEPAQKPIVVDNSTDLSGDRPLTFEEIQRIRQLPIDDSPSGKLQTALEEESKGQYKARY